MVPMGKDGSKGNKENQDHQDPGPRNGGVVFIRWGRTNFVLQTNDTELLYKGKVGGSSYDETGGGANYICLPNEPEFLSYTPGTSTIQVYIYGAEYETYQNGGPFTSTSQSHIPVSYAMFPLEYHI
ncbi:uncharacterized protein LOC121392576 [Gigantopelta aegis]|uniref:uncharacterized protein LOC121392576 n=1 Tax=Gigantopelta aegis TaxID=1735272 RepID=UPI001B88B51C|nr:uncharacterized protein LOC121392576 [Gigantopelta aegis]